MLIIIPPSPVEIITEQSDLFRKIFCYMKKKTTDEAGQREEKTGNKRDKINELRENSRKWRVMCGSENSEWPFFFRLKYTKQYNSVCD